MTQNITSAAGLVPRGMDNTGYATILGEKQFDLAAIQSGILADKKAKEAAAQLAENNALEKRKKAFGSLGYEPAWTRSVDELRAARDGMIDLGIQLESRGGQIDDPSSPAGKMMSDAGIALKLNMTLDKAQKEKYYNWIDEYNKNPNQYPDFWRKMSEFDNLNTIKERQAWMDKNNPLAKQWDYTTWLQRNAVDPYSYSNEKGSETVKNKAIRFKDVQTKIREDRKTPQGKLDYEEGLKNGTWKNEEEQEMFAYNQLKSANPGEYSRTEDEAKGGWKFSSGGGISRSYGNWNVSASRRPSDADSKNAFHDPHTGSHYYNWNNEIRQIDVAQNNKDTPIFYLKDQNGREMNAQITGFERRGNDWYIRGKRVAEKGVKVDIPYKADDDPNETTTLEDFVIPYAGNEQDIAAKMNGFDINSFVQEAQAEMGKKADKGYSENYQTQLLDMTDKSEDAMVGRVNALVSSGYTKVQSKEVENPNTGGRDTYIRFVDPQGQRIEYNLNSPTQAAAFKLLLQNIMK